MLISLIQIGRYVVLKLIQSVCRMDVGGGDGGSAHVTHVRREKACLIR